jgi:hypothetical protein
MEAEVSSETSGTDAATGCKNREVGVGVKLDYRENLSLKICGL